MFLLYFIDKRNTQVKKSSQGVFYGLPLEVGQPELIRSVMEGVALSCYEVFEIFQSLGANPERLIIAGGGARFSLWRRIFAEVFALPAFWLGVTDQSAFGAAVIAGAGIGHLEPKNVIQGWIAYKEPIEPDPRNVVHYQ